MFSMSSSRRTKSSMVTAASPRPAPRCSPPSPASSTTTPCRRFLGMAPCVAVLGWLPGASTGLSGEEWIMFQLSSLLSCEDSRRGWPPPARATSANSESESLWEKSQSRPGLDERLSGPPPGTPSAGLRAGRGPHSSSPGMACSSPPPALPPQFPELPSTVVVQPPPTPSQPRAPCRLRRSARLLRVSSELLESLTALRVSELLSSSAYMFSKVSVHTLYPSPPLPSARGLSLNLEVMAELLRNTRGWYARPGPRCPCWARREPPDRAFRPLDPLPSRLWWRVKRGEWDPLTGPSSSVSPSLEGRKLC